MYLDICEALRSRAGSSPEKAVAVAACCNCDDGFNSSAKLAMNCSIYIFFLPGLALAILIVLCQFWRKAAPEQEGLSKDQSKEQEINSSLSEDKKCVQDDIVTSQQETIAKLQREIEEKDLALAQVNEMKQKVQHEAEKKTLALAKERKNTSNLQNQKQELVLALLWERTTVAEGYTSNHFDKRTWCWKCRAKEFPSWGNNGMSLHLSRTRCRVMTRTQKLASVSYRSKSSREMNGSRSLSAESSIQWHKRR